MAKAMTLEDLRARAKRLKQQEKETQELIRKAEAAEREHIAADIIQACLEMMSQMPEDIRPDLKEVPDLIRKMWSGYFLKNQDLSVGLPSE